MCILKKWKARKREAEKRMEILYGERVSADTYGPHAQIGLALGFSKTGSSGSQKSC